MQREEAHSAQPTRVPRRVPSLCNDAAPRGALLTRSPMCPPPPRAHHHPPHAPPPRAPDATALHRACALSGMTATHAIRSRMRHKRDDDDPRNRAGAGGVRSFMYAPTSTFSNDKTAAHARFRWRHYVLRVPPPPPPFSRIARASSDLTPSRSQRAALMRGLSNSSITRSRPRRPPIQTDPVPSPDVAALTRGSSSSTSTRPRPPRTYIQRLTRRGGLRDRLRRFTTPQTLHAP
ncbi:hypothetical protein EDB85DRAFT_2288557 [Lactarius pseudohatsudake]|nr:hypothetical protein EDB85DRAFT_2288557 [Lactarius pseudohatsudake]